MVNYKFVSVEELEERNNGNFCIAVECLEYDEDESKLKVKDLISEKSIELSSIFKANPGEILWIFLRKENGEYAIDFLKKISTPKELFKRFLKIYYKWGRKYV